VARNRWEAPVRTYELWLAMFRQYNKRASVYTLDTLANSSYMAARFDRYVECGVFGEMDGQPILSLRYGQGCLMVRPDGAFRLMDPHGDQVTYNRLRKHTWFGDGYDMYKRTLVLSNYGFGAGVDDCVWGHPENNQNNWLNVRDPGQRMWNLRARDLNNIGSDYWTKFVDPTGSEFSDVSVEFMKHTDRPVGAPWEAAVDLPTHWTWHLKDIMDRRARYARKRELAIERQAADGAGLYYTSLVNEQAVENLLGSIEMNRKG
jgi:hypothetical protein